MNTIFKEILNFEELEGYYYKLEYIQKKYPGLYYKYYAKALPVGGFANEREQMLYDMLPEPYPDMTIISPAELAKKDANLADFKERLLPYVKESQEHAELLKQEGGLDIAEDRTLKLAQLLARAEKIINEVIPKIKHTYIFI